MQFQGLIAGIALATLASTAGAATTMLYDTGVDASGTPLADGTVGDPHYTLVSTPSGSTSTILIRSTAGVYPIPPYFLGEDPLSTWIGPDNDNSLDGPVGVYDYQTTFYITGNPTTTMITGEWATDNEGLDIMINGVATGDSNSNQFSSFTPFSISSGFKSGLNTLDFLVNNGGGPTALRVEMTSTVSAIPEPDIWNLMLAGVATLGAVLRTRRSMTAVRELR